MFRYNFVPLRIEGHALVVAMADPSDLVVIDEVSALLGRPLIINVAPLSEIQDLLKKSESSQRMLDEATEGFKLDLIREDETGEETITIEKITQEESSPIIRLVDTIIFTALERRASDIHIETRDTEVGVKYRIDGSLSEAMAPIAKEHHSTIISQNQSHVGARHFRAPRSAGRPIQDAIQRPIDRLSCFDHAVDSRRRRRHSYSRQGIHQREIPNVEP